MEAKKQKQKDSSLSRMLCSVIVERLVMFINSTGEIIISNEPKRESMKEYHS